MNLSLSAGHLRVILLLFCLPIAAAAQTQYSFEVTDRRPQSREHFVQGLEIVGDYLWMSTGGYGKSQLLRYNLSSGELDHSINLSPRHFGEGITVMNSEVYQLTWRSGMVLVYHQDTGLPSRWFRIQGEGWGLTHDEKHLIYSDGSDQIHFLAPDKLGFGTQRPIRSISVTEHSAPVTRLNELEYINGMIWANILGSDRLVIINPVSGEIESSVNLSELLPAAERHEDTNVLNGIAFNSADQSIWVTGKRWPWRYQIKLVASPSPDTQN